MATITAGTKRTAARHSAVKQQRNHTKDKSLPVCPKCKRHGIRRDGFSHGRVRYDHTDYWVESIKSYIVQECCYSDEPRVYEPFVHYKSSGHTGI